MTSWPRASILNLMSVGSTNAALATTVALSTPAPGVALTATVSAAPTPATITANINLFVTTLHPVLADQPRAGPGSLPAVERGYILWLGFGALKHSGLLRPAVRRRCRDSTPPPPSSRGGTGGESGETGEIAWSCDSAHLRSIPRDES